MSSLCRSSSLHLLGLENVEELVDDARDTLLIGLSPVIELGQNVTSPFSFGESFGEELLEAVVLLLQPLFILCCSAHGDLPRNQRDSSAIYYGNSPLQLGELVLSRL